MDIAQARQRSASNSSLHNAYKTQSRLVSSTSSARPPSQRRPLRSVHENSALLRCPGPLESMLKTTTETGDIGIFSIKAGASPATYHQPPRQRPYLGDASLLPPARPRLYEDNHSPDEHRRLRSYRDTTSEIISLYGSDNQQYWMRPASPILDDGHRSYSLTTCSSSRQIPSQKSSGTLQSHSSGSGLQRPRSPFPYPTRLKRPGVRPSSPALAENGGVDYTRMVELDRVSQRTIHGSYKPTYAHGPKRPPPLSLRADANRSTASLPSKASPGPYHFGPGPSRIRTPSSSLSGMSRPYDRHRAGSTDHSVRSASLTSIVDMYQRPITAGSTGPPLRSGGSFYYDYSEEFDKPAPLNPGMDPVIPICPIPQRAGSNSRPMVLRADTQAHLDAVASGSGSEGIVVLQSEPQDPPAPIDITVSEARRRHSHGHSIRSIDDVLNGADGKQSPHENLVNIDNADESGLTALVNGAEDMQSAPLNEPRVTNVHVYAVPPKIDSIPDHAKSSSTRGAWRLSKTLGAEPDIPELLQNKRASQSSLTKLRCTLDPALSEFASLFSSFDRLAKTPFSRKGDDTMTTDEELFTGEEDGSLGGYPKRLGRRPSLQLFSIAATDGNAYRRRHRRNAAAMRINTVGLSDFAGSRQELSPPKEELTILSPEPISPARQLRVKNSIPQLMKALPPLPGEARGEYSQDDQDSPEAGKDHSRHDASFSDNAFCEEKSVSDDGPAASPANAQGERQESPRKFKVRVRTSSSPSNVGSLSESYRKGQQGDLRQNFSLAAKPKLKLKLSRSQLGQARSGHGGSFIRTNRLKQCNSLADLASHSSRKMYTGQGYARDDAEYRPRSAAGDGSWEPCEGKPDQPDPSPQPSDQFNIPYPPSPDKAEALLRSSTSTNKVTLSEMRSFNSDVHPVGYRGLRHKLSVLRFRITRTPGAGACKGAEAVAQFDGAGETPQARPACNAPNPNGDTSDETKGRAISTRSEKVGGRVKRWASDAKQAVRAYVRRTLDRSSRLSG
ncbi:Uncharacterized protein TPAR_03639 [Tolypocladium paradoxum]|uniref:Uncharacterized protein n=1 Tax=Tolypocladium paradoxum TaxID=94208 RepID=A0A2S4L165_9HYPO|nr:Uncharacterized protein TPAR_03639 [Tolypocladium paradoxum]